jgi:hypothetical protein
MKQEKEEMCRLFQSVEPKTWEHFQAWIPNLIIHLCSLLPEIRRIYQYGWYALPSDIKYKNHTAIHQNPSTRTVLQQQNPSTRTVLLQQNPTSPSKYPSWKHCNNYASRCTACELLQITPSVNKSIFGYLSLRGSLMYNAFTIKSNFQ